MSFLTSTLARVVPGLNAWSVLIALAVLGMALFFVVIAISLREPRRRAAEDGRAERPAGAAGASARRAGADEVGQRPAARTPG